MTEADPNLVALREALDAYHGSMRELAKAAGVSESMISMFKNDPARGMTATTFNRLSEALAKGTGQRLIRVKIVKEPMASNSLFAVLCEGHPIPDEDLITESEYRMVLAERSRKTARTAGEWMDYLAAAARTCASMIDPADQSERDLVETIADMAESAAARYRQRKKLGT